MRIKLIIIAIVASLCMVGCGAQIGKIDQDRYLVYESDGQYDLNDLNHTCMTEGKVIVNILTPIVNVRRDGSLAIVTCGKVTK